jgi:hypothetical protein
MPPLGAIDSIDSHKLTFTIYLYCEFLHSQLAILRHRPFLDPSMTLTLATLPLDIILCISALLDKPLDVLSLSQVRCPSNLRL